MSVDAVIKSLMKTLDPPCSKAAKRVESEDGYTFLRFACNFYS